MRPSSRRMLQQFQSDPRSVLFGTDSFWQGVDVPGDALQNVIITRLPFSVPDHPLLEARVEALKQGQYEPLPVEKQILVIYAVSNGYVDDYPIDKVRTYEKELYSFFDTKYPELLKDIKAKKEIGDDLRDSILKALDELKAQAAAQSRNLSKGARAAEIEGLKAKVRYAEAQLEQARTQLRRTEQLRNNGFVSDMQTLQERTQVQLAKAQVEDAMAALRTAQQAARVDEQAAAAAGVDAAAAGVAQVEWLLKQKRVTAPVGGVVQELYRRQGEYAQPGATTMTILHSDTLRVRFFVPNDLRPRYLPGAKVKVSISGCDDALEATVTRVSARPEYTQPMMFSLELRDRLSFLTEARLAASSTCTAPPGTPVGIVVPAGEKAAS